MWQRLKALSRTTAVRLSALYLGLFVLCAVALVFYVTAMSEGLLQTQTRRGVDAELQRLGQAFQRGGIVGLVRTVDRRARQPGANLYLVASPNGNILSGNVSEIEPGVLDRTGWTEVPFEYSSYSDPDGAKKHRAMAEVIRLPNGMRLLVGRDLGQPDIFRGLIQQALMIALGVMGIGALLIWFFIGRGALKRIDRMSAASQKIMAGDLSQRLPMGGSGDEFDRLSESLNAMLGRIEKLNVGLRQVSDNIAHDLKTPLTRLRNRAEAALAKDKDAEGYAQALEEMIGESDQLIRTFNALLMISRVEAGSAAAELASVDLSAIATDAAELYEPVTEDADIAYECHIEPGISVNGNRELIGQALTNLIDNAIKYAGEEDGAKIVVALALEDQMPVLSVVDNGVGIPDEQHEEVVKRFVRLDESRSKPGTGLGLSLVEAVMELHGGRLTLTKPAQGRGLSARMEFQTTG